MSKLATQNKFLDLSDYGRLPATYLANSLKNTRITPIHVTLLFGVSGIIAIYCIVKGHYLWAGFFLILKSILDAADGELSRVKNTPSYTGRYLDSIFDIILNFSFLMAIYRVSETPFLHTLLAFMCIQWQGTLYNYYYVILRNNAIGGDSTSKIFENQSPKAFPGERQKTVDVLFTIFTILYCVFDKTIYFFDKKACAVNTFPHWFMTLVSLYGLGFQLLIIAIMLSLGWVDAIMPFFIFYTFLMAVIIGVRRVVLNN